MKVKVNENCIGCGNCVMMTEEKVFSFNDDGMAEAIVEEVPEDMTKTVKEAIDACPVEAIVEEVPEDMTKTVKEAIDACPVEAIEEVPEDMTKTVKEAIDACPVEAIEEKE